MRLSRIAARAGLTISMLLLVVAFTARSDAQARVVDLKVENRVDPIAVEAGTPRFSWRMIDARRGARQTAYAITVTEPDGTTVWRSGRVSSDRSVLVPYAGPPLESRKRYYWSVRIWDHLGAPSPLSPLGRFAMAVLNPSEWRAQWIGISQPACLLRKGFQLNKPIARAVVHATARGVYQMQLNGRRVGNDVLAPGWTDYRVRHLYQTYDVTGHVRQGENAIGAFLGRGWFGSRLGWQNQTGYIYGPGPNRFFAQLHVEFTDGSSTVIVTDGSWRGTAGPITESTLYDGERYDARREQPGWDMPGFNDSGWTAVSAVTLNTTLTAERQQPLRVTESVRPISVSQPASGNYVFDLGKVIVGWVRLRVRGPAGRTVQLRHAEVLQSNGLIDVYNLRSSKNIDQYTLRGTGQDEFFEPKFTYHGFRYVEVTGYPGQPTLNDLVGQIIHVDAPFTGSFNCDNRMVKDVFEATVLGQRGNFNSVPTDCPQRDERLGWTGDANAFWRSAVYNQDLTTYSAKWAQDLRDSQINTGSYVDIAPEIPRLRPPRGAPFWGNAGVTIPWDAYRQYGDTGIIREHYASIKAWLAYLEQNNANFLWQNNLGNNYGDWLAPSGNPTSDRPALATALWARDLKRASLMAAAIGNQADSLTFARDFESVKQAFIATYYNPANGRVASGNQTPQLLALGIGLLPPAEIQKALGVLVRDIAGRNTHLSTGFIGTSFLLPVLSDLGELDLAYRLLTQTTTPSWGYKVLNGGTTMWERWDNDDWCRRRRDSLCSFNHYALGSVTEWLFRYLGGIDLHTTVPGFKRFVIRPRMTKAIALKAGISYVDATYESAHGAIESEWWVNGSDLTFNVTVPPNTNARIHVPDAFPTDVYEGGARFDRRPGLRYVDYDGNATIIDAVAGRYAFRVGGLSVSNDLRPGQTSTVFLSQRSRARQRYQMCMALSNNRGIDVPGAGRIPVDADPLFFLTVWRFIPTVAVNFAGTLDEAGAATGRLALPNLPTLVGYPLHFAAVTFASSGVTYISNGVARTIGQ